MVSQITLGNIYQSNGKTVVGGSQSGLDTKSIIDALVAAKGVPVTTLTDTNKSIDGKLKAYTQLQSLLATFQTSLDALRNPPGVGNASQNIFQYRKATLTTNNGASASSYMNVTVVPGANIQNFAISDVTSLAAATKQQSNDFTLADTTTASVVGASGSSTPNQFSAGTITLRNATGGAGVPITLTQGDSLQAVVNKFNDVSAQTGIQANILKVGTSGGSSTYNIILTSTQTGLTYGFDMASSGTVLSDPSGALSHTSFSTTQPAADASFKLDGVLVQRDSNSISDAIDGVTFNLQQVTTATPGLQINVGINPDTSIVSNAVTQFGDSYNALKLFISTQQQLAADGTPSTDSVLYNEQLLRSVSSQVASDMAQVVSGITGSNPSRLADVGITFTDFAGDSTNPATKNIMNIDTDKLTSALDTNFTGVSNLFGFNLTSDNANLSVYTHTNALATSSFTLNIDRTNGVYTATYLDAGGSTQTATLDAADIGTTGGITLTGQAGTGLEGLQLIYVSTADATIHVTATQGIADRLYNDMNNVTTTTTGTLAMATKDLQDQETRNNTQITKLNDNLATYRDQLTNQYATLEAALSKANNLLALLTAQSNAQLAGING